MLYALCAALSLALLGLDQWVKHYVTVNIPLGDAQPFLPGLVELRTVHNYGAAWSSFSGQRWLLVAVTGCIVLAVAVANLPGLGLEVNGVVLPVVLVWYIFTELGSIAENAAAMGAPVPGWLVRILAQGKEGAKK